MWWSDGCRSPPLNCSATKTGTIWGGFVPESPAWGTECEMKQDSMCWQNKEIGPLPSLSLLCVEGAACVCSIKTWAANCERRWSEASFVAWHSSEEAPNLCSPRPLPSHEVMWNPFWAVHLKWWTVQPQTWRVVNFWEMLLGLPIPSPGSDSTLDTIQQEHKEWSPSSSS